MRAPSPFALLLALPLAAPFLLGGCIKSMLTNGQIAATREAAGSFNTLGDYELARSAAQAGLVQFEGMHMLAPDNEDALFLLTSSWVGYGYGFPQDDWEAAVDKGDDDGAAYQQKRATLAYERAVYYGLELLSHTDKGFAAGRKNDMSMKKWLNDNFDSKDLAPNLFWTGYAWLARVDLNKENPEVVADAWIGVDMVEKAVTLDPSFEHWSGTTVLAAYHARPMGEPDQAKQMFELALEKTQRKNLLTQVTYAQTYACTKADRALYESLLNEVLNAQDPDPEQRLVNTIAKRRAKRYLGKQRMSDCGFDMSAPAAKTPAAPAAPAPAAKAPAASAAPAPATKTPAAPAPAAAAPAAPPAAPPPAAAPKK